MALACLRLDSTMPPHEVRRLTGAPHVGGEITVTGRKLPLDRTSRGMRAIDSRTGQKRVATDELRSMTSKISPLSG